MVEELNTRVEEAAVAQVTMHKRRERVTTMFRQQAPIVFNDADWGPGPKLVELRKTTAPSRAVVTA